MASLQQLLLNHTLSTSISSSVRPYQPATFWGLVIMKLGRAIEASFTYILDSNANDIVLSIGFIMFSMYCSLHTDHTSGIMHLFMLAALGCQWL